MFCHSKCVNNSNWIAHWRTTTKSVIIFSIIFRVNLQSASNYHKSVISSARQNDSNIYVNASTQFMLCSFFTSRAIFEYLGVAVIPHDMYNNLHICRTNKQLAVQWTAFFNLFFCFIKSINLCLSFVNRFIKLQVREQKNCINCFIVEYYLNENDHVQRIKYFNRLCMFKVNFFLSFLFKFLQLFLTIKIEDNFP